jgi:uncharacterized membrane protein YfcA
MDWWLPLGIVFVAALGQSTMGFGGGLVAIPLLTLVKSVKDAVMLALVLQIMVGLLSLRSVRALPWKQLGPMLVALVPASILGSFFLGIVNERVLRICLVVFISLFLLKSLFFASFRLVPSKHWKWGALAGGLGGMIQGTIGTGGPPLVIYTSETMDDKDTMRISILFLLMTCNVLRLGVAIPKGMFHDQLMPLVYAAVPCILVAMVLGQRLHHIVSESVYRKAILVVLFGSVVSLLLKI